MEKRRPIQYSFEDIKRYRQGLMNREEMFAFEKASMEDPFLADALEGYMEADMALADEHLHNITQKITGKSEEKEKAVVVAMPKRSFAMWRVAVMVIVIAGAGLLTYNIFNKEQVSPDNPLAHNETKPVDANPVIPNDQTAIVTDTNGSSSLPGNVKKDDGKTTSPALADLPSSKDRQTQINELPTTENTVKKTDEVAALKEDVVVNSPSRNAAEKQTTASATKISAEETESTQKRNRGYQSNQARNNEIRGRVLNPSNQPLANANVTLDRSKRSFVTDNAGNFTFNANDTVVTATVNVEGYDNTRVQLRSNTDNTISLGNVALQPDATFNEVVVIGLGADKIRVTDTISNKPAGGWQLFKEYLSSKLNAVSETIPTEKKSAGEFELEFYIDGKGTAKDFKVLNASPGHEIISKEAIDAVKKGPKWEPKRKKTKLLILY